MFEVVKAGPRAEIVRMNKERVLKLLLEVYKVGKSGWCEYDETVIRWHREGQVFGYDYGCGATDTWENVEELVGFLYEAYEGG